MEGVHDTWLLCSCAQWCIHAAILLYIESHDTHPYTHAHTRAAYTLLGSMSLKRGVTY